MEDKSYQSIRLLTLKQVLVMVGYSRSWVYAEIKGNRFPTPIKGSGGAGGSSRWLYAEILFWVEERVRTSRKRSGQSPYPKNDHQG